MALAVSILQATFSPNPQGIGGYTPTGTFTPAANSDLLVAVGGQHIAGTSNPGADMAISGGSLTWTKIIDGGDTSAWSHGGAIFHAHVGGSPSAMQVTVTAGGRNMWFESVVTAQFTDANASPVGAKGGQSTAGASGTFSCTLDAAPDAGSFVFSYAQDINGGTTINTGGSGYTELSDNYNSDAAIAVQTQYRTGSTSTTVSAATTTGDEKALILAVEIKAAGGGGSTVTGDGDIDTATTLTGAGASRISDPAQIQGVATLTGAGASVASGAGQIQGTATLTGVGAGSAISAAAGQITAAATLTGSGAATASAGASITAVESQTGVGAAVNASAGSVQAVATQIGVSGVAVIVSAAGSIAANATLRGRSPVTLRQNTGGGPRAKPRQDDQDLIDILSLVSPILLAQAA